MIDCLFPPVQDRLLFEDRLTRLLLSVSQRLPDSSVAPTLDMERFRIELAAFAFEESETLDTAAQWVVRQMEDGLVHVNHPRYFGLFNPTPTFPAQMADRIVAAFNPQLATATTSPVAVAIENHVIQAFARRIGLPEPAQGHFTTGGSEANYTAVIMALTQSCPNFATEGARAFLGAPVFYVSQDSHLAWIKIAHQAGIGRRAARLVPTDGDGQMDMAALMSTIHDDLENGCVPFMIVATAGTTNAGMIDPLYACSELAKGLGLWFHVDAAWGGGLIAHDELCVRLAGIETADSITIDGHKWFAATMGCGIFLTTRPQVLSEAFQVAAYFMPSSNPTVVDPYVSSVQWSRRFLGLRLFLSLAVAGWAGYGHHVEQTLVMGNLFVNKITNCGWTMVNDSPVGVTCIVPPDPASSVRAIVNHVVAAGQAWVSVATFEGREVIRVCVTSGMTTPQDVDDLVAALQTAVQSTGA